MSVFDGLGSLCFPRKKNGTVQPPRRILIIRLDSLGDAVLTLPAICYLEKRFPGSSIDFLVSPGVQEFYALLFPKSTINVFQNGWLGSLSPQPAACLREFFAIAKRLRALGYDLAVDFRGDLRSILLMRLAGIPERWGRDATGGGFLLTRAISNVPDRHEVLQNLELVQGNGILSTPNFSDLGLRLEEVNALAGQRIRVKDGRKIVIHLGAGYPSKRWPVSHFVRLAKEILEAKLGVPIFIGSEAEKNLLAPHRTQLDRDCLNFIGQTTLEELLALLNQADLFIGNDSGPAHLAALLGRPRVVIFSGTNDFRKWAPWGERQRLIRHEVPCSPCEEKKCPLPRHYCMEDIPVQEVLAAAREMLHA